MLWAGLYPGAVGQQYHPSTGRTEDSFGWPPGPAGPRLRPGHGPLLR
jgi:hypothetical protein